MANKLYIYNFGYLDIVILANDIEQARHFLAEAWKEKQSWGIEKAQFAEAMEAAEDNKDILKVFDKPGVAQFFEQE